MSTNRQEAEGLSLEAQEARLRAAGATEVIRDVLSGAKDHRPGYRELLRLVRERQIDGVVITKLDRLGRSLSSRAEVFALFSEPGAPWLKALDDQLDLTTASGRMLADMLGAIATGERERIRERINDGLDERRRRGLLVGQSPWGLRLTRSGAGVEIDPGVQPQVEAVLQIMRQERHLGAAIRRIASELGIERSRSSWRTWLNSPQLAGSVPQGCRHQLKRVYDTLHHDAFTSYLSAAEQAQLITKFSGEARGRKSTYPHPCRKRVKCGACGRSLQRRNDRLGRPRWLSCAYIHCGWYGHTVFISDALAALSAASFHFSRARLEAAVAGREAARSARVPSSREIELTNTLATLRTLPADVVGDAVAKAERELAQLQGQAMAQQGLDAVNLREAVRLLELMVDNDLEDPSEDALNRLGKLFDLAGVTISTAEAPELRSNGNHRLMLATVQAEGRAPIAVSCLPQLGQLGGGFAWKDLAAGLRALG